MKEFLLLLPVIFIIHDMEEIVGFGWFFGKNPWVYKKYPRITKTYQNFKTDIFAVGVYEEFVPFFGVSLVAYYFPNYFLFSFWYGLMLALTGHFLIHIGFSVYIRKFIPSVITSIIFLPICILILIKTAEFLTFDFVTIFFIVIAIIVMILIFRFVHWHMNKLKNSILIKEG